MTVLGGRQSNGAILPMNLPRAGAVDGAAQVGGSGWAGAHANARRTRARSGNTRDARSANAWCSHAGRGPQGDARTGDAALRHADVLAIDNGLRGRGNREEGQAGGEKYKFHVELRQPPGQAEWPPRDGVIL